MKSKSKVISKNLVYRLPVYLTISRKLLDDGARYITAPQISEITGINVETVKKDLSQICETPGYPKLGRDAETLVAEITHFGVYTQITNAVVIGVGHLGQALLNYQGFHEWGLNIAAGFDHNEKLIGRIINGKEIYHMDRLSEKIKLLEAEIAVITVPREFAQFAVDIAVAAGIKGIWNFAPIHINVPNDVVLQNENMASSLSLLNYNLKAKSKKRKKTKKVIKK